ncbi:MAG: hypothetical protein IT347_12425 [Candidatus Eisenbacteria bacterium]|nr:hypothetical protein [Candidatus Eisenbacteria bacterium]
MKSRITRFAVLGAAMLTLTAPAAFAAAASSQDPSAFTLPAETLALAATPVASGLAPEVAAIHVPGVPEVSVAGVAYRPRRSGYGRHVDSYGVSQIHLGFFDPDGDPPRSFLAGIRGGPMLDPHVQVGVGVDWAHSGDRTASVRSTEIGPGGTPITVQREIARSSTDFFPIMAFMQLSADDDLSLVPYFGIAGGYQVLNLSADDYQSGQSFDATYGGWGWQAWGGAAMPLSGRTRVTGEVFFNGGEMGRDVDDPLFGGYRETVKADGFGARFGLAWGF